MSEKNPYNIEINKWRVHKFFFARFWLQIHLICNIRNNPKSKKYTQGKSHPTKLGIHICVRIESCAKIISKFQNNKNQKNNIHNVV